MSFYQNKNVVAHGAFQGGMTEASGGKFWSGFAAGALSSIASSAWSGGSTETTGFSSENGWAYGTKTIHHAGIGIGGNVGNVAFSALVGGGAAELTGGNFWVGAATGVTVSLLNHVAHQTDGDNGYDKNGKQINNNGGDTTDYRYDDSGNITGSTSVFEQGSGSRTLFRGYGFKINGELASGGITQDNTIFSSIVGGKAIGNGLSYLGKGLNSLKVPFARYAGAYIGEFAPTLNKGAGFRMGLSTSRGYQVFRVTYGNNLEHFININLGRIPKIK